MPPWDAIPSFTARDPTMLKWLGLLSWLGGGRQPHFTEDVFSWLDHDILVVDDYDYARMDFRQDLDLALLYDEDWDSSLGMKHVIYFQSFFMFFYFMMFLVDGITKILRLSFTDRAPVWPVGMSLIQRLGALRIGVGPSSTIGGE